jgi:hydroxyacylglutathione hydrolase
VCYNYFHMTPEIKAIKLPLPFLMASVNCYIVKTDSGCILIDTGCANSRRELERELSVGCADNLKLIILTHGDFDHSGNAAYLRQKFGARIAMHRKDSGMVERGDIMEGRGKGPFLAKILAPFVLRFGRSARFKPDFYLEDGDDLAEYGLEAKVIHIPGHSRGSIAILMGSGQLFSGDLLVKKNRPVRNSLIDDPVAADVSITKLKKLKIKTIYPGHGRPFPMELMP